MDKFPAEKYFLLLQLLKQNTFYACDALTNTPNTSSKVWEGSWAWYNKDITMLLRMKNATQCNE